MIVQSHSNLTIGGVHIRQDEAGRYCLNDLHKSAGGEKRHQPSNWLQLQQTIDLIAEISKPGIPGLEQIQPLNVIHGGNKNGTYVILELVYAYAMWISPSFHVTVIRAYHAIATSTRAVALPQDFYSDLRTLLNNAAQAMTDACTLVDKYCKPRHT